MKEWKCSTSIQASFSHSSPAFQSHTTKKWKEEGGGQNLALYSIYGSVFAHCVVTGGIIFHLLTEVVDSVPYTTGSGVAYKLPCFTL